MMRFSEPFTPPRWTRVLLDLALPADPMREAILGDLHEEFVHDASEMDERRVLTRHVRRCAGIVTRALLDAAICRNWVSTTPAAARPQVTEKSSRALRLLGDAAFGMLALFVLVVGIVGNTMLFSATETQGARLSSAAGIGGVALFVASVVIAASVMCIGPRWLRKRLSMTNRLSN